MGNTGRLWVWRGREPEHRLLVLDVGIRVWMQQPLPQLWITSGCNCTTLHTLQCRPMWFKASSRGHTSDHTGPHVDSAPWGV